MPSPLEAQAALIGFQDASIRAAVGTLTPAAWLRTLGTANSVYWLTGHLAATRRETVRLLGGVVAPKGWETAFYTGGHDDGSKPPGPALVDDLVAVGAILAATLRSFDEAAARRAPDRQWPGVHTMEGLALYRFWHETYHVGQLGVLRRALEQAG